MIGQLHLNLNTYGELKLPNPQVYPKLVGVGACKIKLANNFNYFVHFRRLFLVRGEWCESMWCYDSKLKQND